MKNFRNLFRWLNPFTIQKFHNKLNNLWWKLLLFHLKTSFFLGNEPEPYLRWTCVRHCWFMTVSRALQSSREPSIKFNSTRSLKQTETNFNSTLTRADNVKVQKFTLFEFRTQTALFKRLTFQFAILLFPLCGIS